MWAQAKSIPSTLVPLTPFSPSRVPSEPQESISHDVLLLDKRQTHSEVLALTRIRPGISTMNVMHRGTAVPPCEKVGEECLTSGGNDLLALGIIAPASSCCAFLCRVIYSCCRTTRLFLSSAWGRERADKSAISTCPSSLQYRHVLFCMSSVTDLNNKALRNWTQRGEYHP